MAATTLFEDIFEVLDVDPDEKKFVKGMSRMFLHRLFVFSQSVCVLVYVCV